MEWVTLTFILLFTWILYKLFRPSEAKGKAIPGPKGYPLVGCGFELTPDNIFDKFYEFAEKHGEIYQIRIFQTTNVVLNSQELIQKAFCDEQYKSHFNNRPWFFFGEYFYGKDNTIVFYRNSNEPAHGEMKRALGKGLHVYGDGVPQFEENSRAEIQRLMNKIDGFNGEEFDMLEVLRESMSNLISIIIIGENTEADDMDVFWELIESQDFFGSAIATAILSTFPYLVYIPGYYKTKYDRALRAKDRFLEKYFRRMKETRKPEATRGIVDWYLNLQQKELDEGREPFMTDARIKDLILEILVTATVTTWSMLSSVMLCLVNHKNYQEEIQQEMDMIKGPLSSEAKRSCPFTEAAILESERYLPPTPVIGPHVCAKDINFEGFRVKQGTTVFPNAWYIHHDPKIWDDPWVFRPERFLDNQGEVVSNTHIYRKSTLPFGTGRRQCPAESLAQSRLFMYVGTLLKSFTLIPSESRCGTCDPRTGQFEKNFLLRPKPFYCRAVKREAFRDNDL